jgi:hypothetical protein
VIRYGRNATHPDSVIADRKMRIGVKYEMVEKLHVYQAEYWRCLQLNWHTGASDVLGIRLH